jgi:hypothetical protein
MRKRASMRATTAIEIINVRNLSITAGKLAGKLLVESGHADPVSRHP